MQRKYRGVIDKLIVDLPVNTGRTSRQNHSYYPWNMEDIKNTKKFLFLAAIVFGCAVLLVYGNQKSRRTNLSQRERTKMADKIMRTDKEWKKLLTPLQYKITRKKGTERSSTGKYHNFKAEGIYQCLCCGNEIFNSETKFDSGTGWPSFWDVISPEKIEKVPDNSLLSLRTEVACSKCDAHLGHVFNDGPKPTGLRYCINSAALKFVSKAEKYKKATFAAGCFWGVEAEFRKIEGVKSTTVGYSGGDFENPTYSDVCAGKTGHAEAVEIVYDPEKVSYEELLEIFWNIHDPTLLNRQGPDIGTQYRSVILFDDAEQESAAKKSIKTYQAKSDKPVVTEIVPVSRFYRAEEYHQQYLEKQVGKSCNF